MFFNKEGRLMQLMIWVLVASFFAIYGCSTLPREKKNSSKKGASNQAQKNAPLYHDFEDVLIPRELKMDRDSSFIYQTSGFSFGLLALKARIEINSLIAFFETNMRKDNWRLISAFKGERTMMLFQKENRWCIINMKHGSLDYNTLVEIWLAPTLNKIESDLLK
jgi:hypothetical protein